MARPKQFDPEATLDLAVDAFWERGFDATSIQDLCVRLELNPGSLYGTYGDKRALFAAIFDRYLETVSRDAIERIARNPSGVDGIHDYFGFLVEAIVNGKRRWGCLVTNSLIELSAREPEIATKVELHFARLETAFAGALARAQAAGELPAGIGPQRAPYLVCIVQGLNVLARTKPTRAWLKAIVETALEGFSTSSRHG